MKGIQFSKIKICKQIGGNIVGKEKKHLLEAHSPFQALFSYSRLFRAKGLYDKKI